MSRETVGDEVRSGDLTVEALNTSAINPAGGDVRVGSSGTPLTALHVDVDSQPDMTTVTDTRDRGALMLTMESGGTQGSGELGPSLAFGGINTTRRRAAITAVQTTSDPDQVGLAFHVHGSTSSANDTVTEALRIDHAGLITGSGTSLGAWTAYTPTLGGTGWAIGDGTTYGNYCQIGKVVHFYAQAVLGSTLTVAAAAPSLTLPVTGVNIQHLVACYFQDISAATQYTAAGRTTTTTVVMSVVGTNGQHSNPSTTSPFTWASGDVIRVHGSYQAA